MKDWFLIASLFIGGNAAAGELSPDTADLLDPYQLARAISLDVRGVVPEASEVEQIAASGSFEDAMLDAWLESEEFEAQVIEHHRSLFWNKASFTILKNRNLSRQNGVYFGRFLSTARRGRGKTGCTDYPADVNELNQPQSWIERSGTSNGIEYNWKDEGMVEVQPWWDMETTVKVCAYDAQLTSVSSTGTDCSMNGANDDPECGCGENLKWCSTGGIQASLLEDMSTALTERVRILLQADRPYSDLLTSSTVLLNGRIAEYYRNRSSFSSTVTSPLDVDQIPDIPVDAYDTWVEVEGDEAHAGVLTEPGWMLRHQTNRGRANRFYGAFLCKEFIPPPDGIAETNEEDPTPDLSRRPGCKDCHALLEPWSSGWGRWKEVGSRHFSADDYPDFSQECYDCAINGGCSSYCRNNYLVRATHPDQEPFLGWYLPYIYLKQEEAEHPTAGPKLWAQESIDDGYFARCASQNAARWLLGWSDDEMQADQVDAWTADFIASGLSYRALIRSIITSPVYGRSK
ncbi:MAG: hypothetical protein VX278_21725 [Myxococcota bacterium]|nr:hypothetical protein [Myxococcota bacterium]